MFEASEQLAWIPHFSVTFVGMTSAIKKYLPYFGVLFGVLGIVTTTFWQKSLFPQAVAADVTSCYSEVLDTQITVYVSGAVTQGGVYTLNTGSRVADAIQAAGGVTTESDQMYIAKQLNLAEKLIDSQQIYIPFRSERSTSISENSVDQGLTQSSSSTISINTASLTELTALPKIGDKTAEKIIAGRPYSSVDELVDKKIVSASVFNEIKRMIAK